MALAPLYVPAGQYVGTTVMFCLHAYPAGQPLHSDAPGWLRYPAGHSVMAALPEQ